MSIKKYYKLYLKPEDLQGKTATVKISKVTPEFHYSIKDKREIEMLVLEFEGKKRAMILNRAQADDLSRVTGEEEEDQKWVGHVISLSPIKGYSGKQTIKISQPKAAADQLFKARNVLVEAEV